MLNKGYLTAKTDKQSDEVFTPAYAVEPLIPYLLQFAGGLDYEGKIHSPKDLTIWCPFDTEDSEYVKQFKKIGFKTIASHIDNGQNFFDYEPEENYHIIVSNPPFSIKDLVLKRLFELNKPYAMLMPLPALQGQKRFPYIKNCEALIFDKRINFYKDKNKKEIQKGVSFASIYLCKDFLPERLIFRELDTDAK